MEKTLLNNVNYELIINCRDDETAWNSFNNLVNDTFKFTFDRWNKDGYWKNQYIPYSISKDNKIISNVSVNTMNFSFFGNIKKAIQIGTVMTAKEHKNRGLARFLMERVLKDWSPKADFIYLYSNDSASDFYPKFNFSPINETQYSKKIETKKSVEIKKLNIKNSADIKLLYKTVSNSKSISDISLINYPEIIMFHCTYFLQNNIYYIPDFEAIIIIDKEDNKFLLMDTFFNTDVSLDDILSVVSNKFKINKIYLGFMPKDTKGYNYDLYKEEDSTLFIYDKNIELFESKKFLFPLLSHT